MNEDIAKSVARSTTSMFGQQIITWGSSFILMIFMPRYLGPVDYGRLYLAQMISGMFLIMIEYDGRYGIAKRISRDKENTAQILSNSMSFRAVIWVAAFIGMMTMAFLIGYPTPVKILLVIMGLEMLWLAAKSVLVGSFLGHEKMQYTSMGAIAERSFIAVFGVTALLLGANVIAVAVIIVTGTFINFLICLKHSRVMLAERLPRVKWDQSRTLIKEGVPYLLWALFGVIYYRIDALMLSLFTPEKVVGWYAAAFRFFDILAFLPSIYSLAILPILSKLYGKENMMLARTTQKSQEFILIAGIPLSIGVFAFAQNIIALFFGLENYGPSVLNLQIFSVGLVLIYVDIVLGTAVIACDKQRQWAAASFVAILINVTLNYFMIPYTQSAYGNGGIGAALATLITEFFIMMTAISILPKELFSPSSVPISLKAIGAGILMGGAIWLMRATQPFPWVAQIVVAAIVYITALILMRAFNDREIAFAKRFLTKDNLRGAFIPHKGSKS